MVRVNGGRTPATSRGVPSGSEGIIYAPGGNQSPGALPPGNPGEVLTSRGSGLPPAWTLPQEIQAFVTGSPLAANPDLANPAARFNAIDHEDGILAYAAVDTGSSTRWNWVVPRGKDGAPLYVRVGNGGAIETSEDGEAWTARTSGTSQDLNSIIYDGVRYIAVGTGGKVLYSTGGITWFGLASNLGSGTLTCIAKAPESSLYVITGSGPAVYCTSDNPLVPGNWTMASGLAVIPAYYSCVGRGSTVVVVGAQGVIQTITATSLTTRQSGSPFADFRSVIDDGTNFIAAGQGGAIYTSPTGTSWTARTSGTTEELRPFTANGYVYAVGSNGVSRMSSDHGETWTEGPPVGVTSFLRYGVTDPYNPTRALVVGDGGVMLEGKFPFRASVYDNATDRSNRANALGEAFYAYSNTPLQVTIPGQITYQTGIIGIGDVPIEFDVVTIADIIFAVFATNNPSLSPGPYRCFNAYYDFGEGKWKFGPESTSNYAYIELFDSATGTLYVKVSTTAGAAGEEITWKDLYSIDKDGGATFESLKGAGSRAVMVDANGKLSAP